jgi:hypothetical protein
MPLTITHNQSAEVGNINSISLFGDLILQYHFLELAVILSDSISK